MATVPKDEAKKTDETPPAETPATYVNTFPAFTLLRKGAHWTCLTVTIGVDADGNAKVLKTEATDEDLKIIALEAFKIKAYKWWTSL